MILGQNPQTIMIPIYSTTVLYDTPSELLAKTTIEGLEDFKIIIKFERKKELHLHDPSLFALLFLVI